MNKVLEWFKLMLKRVLLVVIMFIVWFSYPFAVVFCWTMYTIFIVFVMPIVWILAGTEISKCVWRAALTHHSDKWWVDMDCQSYIDGEFMSLTPLYPVPISDYLFSTLL